MEAIGFVFDGVEARQVRLRAKEQFESLCDKRQQQGKRGKRGERGKDAGSGMPQGGSVVVTRATGAGWTHMQRQKTLPKTLPTTPARGYCVVSLPGLVQAPSGLRGLVGCADRPCANNAPCVVAGLGRFKDIGIGLRSRDGEGFCVTRARSQTENIRTSLPMVRPFPDRLTRNGGHAAGTTRRYPQRLGHP